MLARAQKAAQYVRMSTDMQKHSIENQAAAIALYAAQNGLEIVRTYEDVGKSGLRIKGRSGLKQLISDVVSGSVNFSKILVYDVSRWGRFQDNDESAHYEFLCRSSGVQVEYCAEQFTNDGSVAAALLKNVKRAMAGEFSRDLSAKVFTGQSRTVRAGFRIGSTPGFGLKRVLVDEAKNRIADLAFGQQKSLRGQHTILSLGNPNEVKLIHYVYDLFLDDGKSLNEIARVLNSAGSVSASGYPWYWYSVRELLANEKYMGNSVYNRSSRKLGGRYQKNPKSEWVRGLAAFDAVVSPERFAEAQERLRTNIVRHTSSFMLDVLTAIWCSHGELKIDYVLDFEGAPAINSYRARFGSLTLAFDLIGYKGRKNRLNNLEIRREMRRKIMSGVPERGGSTSVDWKFHPRINSEFTVSVGVGRTKSSSPVGSNEWQFGYRSNKKPDFYIIARVDKIGTTIRDYFVIPYIFLPHGAWLTVSGKNYSRLNAFRMETLDPFLDLCARDALDEPQSVA
ncbi:MAG: recombinase family protein [Prosthecobacter sp.]|nr:recombinase family protein [Prosthecobacter sp.]